MGIEEGGGSGFSRVQPKRGNTNAATDLVPSVRLIYKEKTLYYEEGLRGDPPGT